MKTSHFKHAHLSDKSASLLTAFHLRCYQSI